MQGACSQGFAAEGALLAERAHAAATSIAPAQGGVSAKQLLGEGVLS